ncbi:MAG: CDP-alcohol phosphatidyltransferase family protein [Chloroflexi bacterium]|nr:CDP-alcohol phosphatidyltransferase family protein [Chloroflexota bacterium]
MLCSTKETVCWWVREIRLPLSTPWRACWTTQTCRSGSRQPVGTPLPDSDGSKWHPELRITTSNVLRRLNEVALPGREELRGAVLRYVEIPGARAFNAVGLTPNSITLIGFLICAAAAAVVALGWPLYAGVVFLLGGILDLFDGALARLTGKASPFGALLDSVFDRLGEASLFVGLGIYYLLGDLPSGQLILSMLSVLLGLVFSQGVSYLRARGEGLGAFTRSGIMTRTERVIILGAGLIVEGLAPVPIMVWVLWVIAGVSCFTLFQRMFTIRGILEREGE